MVRYKRFDSHGPIRVDSGELISRGSVDRQDELDEDVYPASRSMDVLQQPDNHVGDAALSKSSSDVSTVRRRKIPEGYVASPFPRPVFVMAVFAAVNIFIALTAILAVILFGPAFDDVHGLHDNFQDTGSGLKSANIGTAAILNNIEDILNSTVMLQQVTDQTLQRLVDASNNLQLSQGDIAEVLNQSKKMMAFLTKNMVVMNETLYLSKTATATIQQSVISAQSVEMNSYITCEDAVLKRAPANDRCTNVAGLGGNVGY